MPMLDGRILDLETAVKDGILDRGCGMVTSFSSEKLDLRTMIQELESIEVPFVFICPISLEPMQDPVTLCTGQTYERSNILKWLSLGHLTCPTTMQELWDDSITPNKTLLHLIISWFSQKVLATRKKSQDVERRVIELLSSLKKAKGQSRIHALKELKQVVTSHANIKKTILDNQGVDLLISMLGPFTSHATGSEVVGILANLPFDSDSKLKSSLLHPSRISIIIDMMNEGCIYTKIDCIRLIQFLIEGKNHWSETISSLSLVVGLMRIVKDRRHPNGIFASLSLLKLICSSETVRNSSISMGLVPHLVELLPYLNSECLELALLVLELLVDVAEGRLSLMKCENSIPNLVRLLMNVSERCGQLALSILWAMVNLAPECTSMAVEAGLAAKLLLVIQSTCCPAVKQQSAELLKLCSLNYTTSLFISKCKLTRTLQ